MIVYHVCGIKKFLKSLSQGILPAPVRAWRNIEDAERFSKKTGRQIILRLRFSKNTKRIMRIKREAYQIDTPYPINEWFCIGKVKISR